MPEPRAVGGTASHRHPCGCRYRFSNAGPIASGKTDEGHCVHRAARAALAAQGDPLPREAARLDVVGPRRRAEIHPDRFEDPRCGLDRPLKDGPRGEKRLGRGAVSRLVAKARDKSASWRWGSRALDPRYVRGVRRREGSLDAPIAATRGLQLQARGRRACPGARAGRSSTPMLRGSKSVRAYSSHERELRDAATGGRRRQRARPCARSSAKEPGRAELGPVDSVSEFQKRLAALYPFPETRWG